MADRDPESKGDGYVRQAEKKLGGISFFGGNKYDEAMDLYESAATQYKIAKNWDKAGDAYLAAAEGGQKGKDESRATEFYTNAGQMYRKTNPAEAFRVYSLAAEMHMNQNHFSTAAKLYKSIGEICEEDHDAERAQDAFKKAADCYSAEDQNTSKCQMLLKVAHFASQQEDFKQAIEIYEEVANDYLKKPLTQGMCKEIYFKSLLIQMLLAAKAKTPLSTYAELDAVVDKYKSNYPAFEDTREAKLVDAIIDGMKDEDVQKMQDAIVDFDSIITLKDWEAGILIQIKNRVKEISETEEIHLT